MNRFLAFLALGLLLLWPAALTQADQMIPLPVDTLTAQADKIVHGKVVSTTVQKDPEGRIYTSVDIEVTEVWKGSVTTNHCTLVHGGGILGEEISTVSGEAEYQVGEEIVSFMVLNKRGQGVSLGLSQGKFLVAKDSATGELLVHNHFHGRHPSSSNPSPSQKSHGIQNRLTLDSLKQQVSAVGK